MVVPGLEQPAALASPLGALGLRSVTWAETDDPYALVASLLPGVACVGLDNQMAAEKVLAPARRPARRRSRCWPAPCSRPLRRRKSGDEVEALRGRGAAIDRVHAQVPGSAACRAHRAEPSARTSPTLILAEGHARVDFVIVASGPNGASPHHEVSDRVLEPGDVVVVDIGGTMPDGYCSDETRTYAVGQPPEGVPRAYAVLRAAQEAAVAHVRPG